MRRLISISTAVALVLSLASPVLAETCMKTSRASCHRVSQAALHHHCDGMPGHEEMPAPASGDSVSNAAAACPMNCCIAAHAGKQVAVANSIAIAPQLAISAELQFVAVVFTASGFSSHTDRGPPAQSSE
jgi:hypothetical protein